MKQILIDFDKRNERLIDLGKIYRQVKNEFKNNTKIDNDRILLLKSLELAVPLWISEIQGSNLSTTMIEKRARHCGAQLAEKGDMLMFKSRASAKDKGSEYVFNRVAEGIACIYLLAPAEQKDKRIDIVFKMLGRGYA